MNAKKYLKTFSERMFEELSKTISTESLNNFVQVFFDFIQSYMIESVKYESNKVAEAYKLGYLNCVKNLMKKELDLNSTNADAMVKDVFSYSKLLFFINYSCEDDITQYSYDVWHHPADKVFNVGDLYIHLKPNEAILYDDEMKYRTRNDHSLQHPIVL